jgi:hypothetical protein
VLVKCRTGEAETIEGLIDVRDHSLFVDIAPRKEVAVLISCALLGRHGVVLHGG